MIFVQQSMANIVHDYKQLVTVGAASLHFTATNCEVYL